EAADDFRSIRDSARTARTRTRGADLPSATSFRLSFDPKSARPSSEARRISSGAPSARAKVSRVALSSWTRQRPANVSTPGLRAGSPSLSSRFKASAPPDGAAFRSEEHTSELQSRQY